MSNVGSNSRQTLHRKTLSAESSGKRILKSRVHAKYPYGFLNSTANPLCWQSQFSLFILVCVGKGALRCKSSTHRGVRPHLTLWLWWQGFPQLSATEALHFIGCRTAPCWSGNQALFILCNVFISNSRIHECIIQLYSYNSMYSCNYAVITVMNCFGENGHRISGKHHKLVFMWISSFISSSWAWILQQ